MARLRIVVLIFLAVASQNIFAGDLYSLRPRPKAAFARSGQFVFNATTFLVRPNNPTASTWSAIELLQQKVKPMLGDTLLLIKASQYIGGAAVIIGERTDFGSRVVAVSPPGEAVPGAQGYVIDVSPSTIFVVGSDTDGTCNGVATLLQLLNAGTFLTVGGVHVWDVPDYPMRWVSASLHVANGGDFSTMRTLMDSLFFYKLNGVMHTDAAYGATTPLAQAFFDSTATLRSVAQQHHVDVVPQGIGNYAQILSVHPNEVEGAPVTQSYAMNADTGIEIVDPRVALPNGDFETLAHDSILTGTSGWTEIDSQNVSVFTDHAITHGGTASARFQNFSANTSDTVRVMKRVSCSPHKSYFLSAWIRTLGYAGKNPALLVMALDTGGLKFPLTITDYQIAATNGGWQQVQVPFNTQRFSSFEISCEIVGGTAGQVWWDDVQIVDAGLANILRRNGTPLSMTDKRTNNFVAEVTDIIPIIDTILNKSGGNYGTDHSAPTLQRTTTGVVQNGDTINISCFEPLITNVNTDGSASAMVCVSEDSLYTILKSEIIRADTLLHPREWMFSNNFPAALDWDSACTKRNLSPGELWARYNNRLDTLLRSVHSAAKTMVPEMIFDTLQTAAADSSFINGTLTTALNAAAKNISIVNDNAAATAQSLGAIASHGIHQLGSIFADTGGTAWIQSWRRTQDTVANMLGGVYNTPTNNFQNIKYFADYYWSAGPFIVHSPLDTTALNADTVRFTATVLPDVDDAHDSILSVKIQIVDSNSVVLQSAAMTRGANNIFSGTTFNPNRTGFKYRIAATDSEGFTRFGVVYSVGAVTLSTALAAPKVIAPANDSMCMTIVPSFSWSAVAGAAKYHVQISTAADFSSIAFEHGNIFTLQNSAPALQNEMQYFWRVRAEQGITFGAWSATRSFTTIAAVPQIIAPPDSTVSIYTTQTFSWQPAANATSYGFAIDTVPNFFANQLISTTSATSIARSLQVGHKYFWGVMVADQNMCGAWTAAQQLIILDSSLFPKKLKLISPQGPIVIDSAHTVMQFLWNKGTMQPDKYEIFIDADSDTTNNHVDLFAADTSTAVILPIPYVGFWFGRAHNATGWGDYSDTMRFAVTRPTEVRIAAPSTIVLSMAALPNPFASSTTIHIRLAAATLAELDVADILGNTVARLHSGWMRAGENNFLFDAAQLPAGAYFCNLKTSSGMLQKLMMVAR